MPRPVGIGRAEMDVLRFVADHHPVTVREVAEFLAETKGHTRTTALNLMERLRVKGHLTREKSGSVFVYSPCQPKPQLLRGLVSEFVDRVLGGSLEPFVAYLVQDTKVSEAELAELRRLIQSVEMEPPSGSK